MKNYPKIIITGANGFLGQSLCRWFVRENYEVVGLLRSVKTQSLFRADQLKYCKWDGEHFGAWCQDLEGAVAVINLAGRSVNCRYGKKNRRLILKSRVNSTKCLGEAIRKCKKAPQIWINSSTATIYRHAEDGPQDEKTGELGTGFSVDVAKAWEEAFFGVDGPADIRKVAMRSALVLGNTRGTVFSYLLKLSKFGLGGQMSHGRQRVSWISEVDFCRVTQWFIENPEASGIYNVVAPENVSNKELMREFRRLAGRPWGLPATSWMLEIGAFFMRTETELILKSRWVKPQRLVDEGFHFSLPNLREALNVISQGKKKPDV